MNRHHDGRNLLLYLTIKRVISDSNISSAVWHDYNDSEGKVIPVPRYYATVVKKGYRRKVSYTVNRST
jgi:hypothetical protein